MPTSKRIVLTTFGSLGDLHPYMAAALALQSRGHSVAIATGAYYREKIETAGIEFQPVRPDFPDREEVKRLVRSVLNMSSGPETIIRHVVLPHLRDSYADLTRAVAGADLLVTHPLTYAGPIVAEKRGILWASTALQPISLFSLFDETVWAPAPWLSTVQRVAPALYRALLRQLMRKAGAWASPILDLRSTEGLPPPRANPIFAGSHSPHLVLAMFSDALATRMPDWPPVTVVTGFPFYDNNPGSIKPDVDAFLDAGPAPVVFTLGSSAVMDAGQFYQESARAAATLGVRGLLLAGDEPENCMNKILFLYCSNNTASSILS